MTLGSLGSSLFDLDLGVDEKILRSLLVFGFLVIALRLGGKRELAQINVLDLAVLLLASNALQNALIGDDSTVTGGVIGAGTLFAANYLFVRLTFRSARARRLLEGKPVILVEGGVVDRDELRRQAIAESDLLSLALERGFPRLQEVGLVVLETNGHIAMLSDKAAEQWKRGQMMGVGPSPQDAQP
jgi:uncharacterized membrane protein YcaP (DUF421 family)